MPLKKRILVAPLNWGLGHATRCIPIVKALIASGFEPILASDGDALRLLKKEFPHLETIALPPYNIRYPKWGRLLKFKLLFDSLKILRAIKAEHQQLQSLIKTYGIQGIISDNRLGIHSKEVPSAIITHQLQVLSGNTTWMSTKMHQKAIKRFDECWVPDLQGEFNLSGKLGHFGLRSIPVKYIGPLSRFEKMEVKIKYDVMVLLSGPEPQRSILEEKLMNQLKSYQGKVLFVKGKVETEQHNIEKAHMVIYNFMTSEELEKAINESEIIVSRSGYTTIMDLAKLGKKAFFIPTPGQFEQEYLAERLTALGLVPSCRQHEFALEQLNRVCNYKGLPSFDFDVNYGNLFGLFKGK